MNDYIKREDALQVIADNNFSNEITLGRYDKIIGGIYDIPSADVAPVRHGRWIGVDDAPHEAWECDQCGCIYEEMPSWTPPYCPNCGARMEEDHE